MKGQSVDFLHIKYASKDIYNQLSRYTISSKDIYFSIAGTIGKVGTVPQELDGALLTENAAKLEGIGTDLTNIFYLVNVLESDEVKLQHQKMLSRVAQSKLALIKLKNTLIPLPPLKCNKKVRQSSDNLD